VKKPQEGSRIREGYDKPDGSLRLRGVPRGSAVRPGKRHAWVDAMSFSRAADRAESKARGRRQETNLPRPCGTNPGEERGSGGCKREPLEGQEANGKGTAMVAKGDSFDARDPRPRGGNAGGSSGGQVGRQDQAARRERLDCRQPRMREPQERIEAGAIASIDRARSKTSKALERPRRNEPELAARRGWNEEPSGRCARLKTLKGTTNPMRGGGTHWACAEAKSCARWMSTGHARVMR